MRRLLLIPLALLLALAAAPAALAGGWATAGLSSTPDGVGPGEPRTVEITVLQHGRTPLAGLTPEVWISSGGDTKKFAAKPTGERGVYRAEVVFPKAGRWTYTVLDGFNNEFPHTYPAVEIGDGGGSPAVETVATPAPPAPAPADPEGGIAAGWLWGAGAALLLALAVLGLDRRRRLQGRLPGSPEAAA